MTTRSSKWKRGLLSTFYVRAEVVANLPQDEVDVVLPRDGVSRHAGGRVSGPRDGHLLPWQEEDDTSVARRWIQQTHVVRAVGKKKQEVFFIIIINKYLY